MASEPQGRKLSDAVPHYHCVSCYDRGYTRVRKLDGRGYGTGPWLIMDCEACGGRGRKRIKPLTEEQQRAVDWFASSQPPAEPFLLRPGRLVRNPKSWWEMIRFDLSEQTDDKYREAAINCAVRCFEIFGGQEKELDLGEEKELEL